MKVAFQGCASQSKFLVAILSHCVHSYGAFKKMVLLICGSRHLGAWQQIQQNSLATSDSK